MLRWLSGWRKWRSSRGSHEGHEGFTKGTTQVKLVCGMRRQVAECKGKMKSQLPLLRARA
jgi:hypothetical protein